MERLQQKIGTLAPQPRTLRAILLGRHTTHHPKLTSLVCRPDLVYQILSQAGAPLAPQELEPPINRKEYDFAVRSGHFIRQRFFISDLLYYLEWQK